MSGIKAMPLPFSGRDPPSLHNPSLPFPSLRLIVNALVYVFPPGTNPISRFLVRREGRKVFEAFDIRCTRLADRYARNVSFFLAGVKHSTTFVSGCYTLSRGGKRWRMERENAKSRGRVSRNSMPANSWYADCRFRLAS